MLKYVLLTSLLVSPVCAMLNKNKNFEKKWIIPKSCFDKIQQIDKDLSYLYYTLFGALKAVAEEHSDKVEKPSELLTYYETEKISMDAKFSFLTGPEYIEKLLRPHYEKFDNAFKQKNNEINNLSQTWEWFGTYLEKELLKAGNTFKQKLVASEGILFFD